MGPLLLQSLALVQAGGGGSFGGGGGGGGGGFGGDGDGGLWVIYYVVRGLIHLTITAPWIGIPVDIVVVMVLYQGWKSGAFVQKRRTIRKHRKAVKRRRSAQSAEVLRQSDPGFDEASFLDRVRKAFLKAQESWCAQDLEPLTCFISDGVFERFSIQIDEQRLEGWRQGMADVSVRSVQLADVDVGDQYDRLTVRISFNADIHRIGLKSGKKLSGSTLPRVHFAEAWTFLRGHGTKSLNAAGLMEGQCPNCAAPLVMVQSSRCQHCECHARSGQFDWVLAEITQWSEWAPESSEAIVGLQAYRALDPGWHPQPMEDLTSVVFWRLNAVHRRGQPDLLAGHATEEYFERLSGKLERRTAANQRRFYVDCAVGSVRTLGLLPGPERDRVLTEVVWDGRWAKEKQGQAPKASETRSLRHTEFVFSRGAGSSTDRSSAFSTAHCRECGAHDDGQGAPSCRFCGAARAGDPSLWLLEDVCDRGSPRGKVLIDELDALRVSLKWTAPGTASSRPTSPTGLLRWSIGLVHADGEVTPGERTRIHALASRVGISSREADELLQGVPDQPDGPSALDESQAQPWMKELIGLALEDGKVGRKELAFLKRTARALGIRPREYDRLLRGIQRDLYRETVEAKRSGRG